MSSSIFLSDSASQDDLFLRMESPDREEFAAYKSLKMAGAFLDRIFIVYRNTDVAQEPKILTQVRVTAFRTDARLGSEVEIEDLRTHEVLTVGYIPKRLFNYDIFVGVANRQRVNWDASLVHGVVRRSMSFGLLLKERSRSGNYSVGTTAIETPVGFRALFPEAPLHIIPPR